MRRDVVAVLRSVCWNVQGQVNWLTEFKGQTSLSLTGLCQFGSLETPPEELKGSGKCAPLYTLMCDVSVLARVYARVCVCVSL